MKLGVQRLVLAVTAAAVVGASSSTTAEDTVALAPDGKQPRAAVGGHLVAVVYGQGEEIFCRVSRDEGASYSEPTRVGRVGKLLLGMRRGPQVAVSRTGIIVTAVGRDGDVVSWRSTDAGRTWTGPVKVNDKAHSAREGLQSLAADANDGVHAVWLDLRDAHTKIFGATSRDGGASWGANRLIYESPEGPVCECCQPTVAADSAGHVAVMWRNSLSGARDMYVTWSNDAGRSFGVAEKLGRGNWPLSACPMDGGGVAVAGGRVAAVFRREDVVYAAALGSEEQPIGKGKNAAVAAASDGTYLAWQTLDGNVLLKAPNSAVAVVVGPGRFPVLAAAPGADAPVVLTWEDPERGTMVRTIRMPKPTPTE